MYTPDEKKALAELQGGSYKTRYETTIKEVEGGFIITHAVSYANCDEIVGQTREQFVCADLYAVTEAITNLYGDRVLDDAGPIPVLNTTRPDGYGQGGWDTQGRETFDAYDSRPGAREGQA